MGGGGVPPRALVPRACTVRGRGGSWGRFCCRVARGWRFKREAWLLPLKTPKACMRQWLHARAAGFANSLPSPFTANLPLTPFPLLFLFPVLQLRSRLEPSPSYGRYFHLLFAQETEVKLAPAPPWLLPAQWKQGRGRPSSGELPGALPFHPRYANFCPKPGRPLTKPSTALLKPTLRMGVPGVYIGFLSA